MRARWSLPARVVLAAAALVAVGASVASDVAAPVIAAGRGDASSAAAGGTVTVPMIADPGSIDPILARDLYGQAVVSLLYPSLATIGPGGRRVLLLARSWTLTDQGRTVHIVLRAGLRWTDGRPVTATDVATTFAAMANRADGSPYYGVFRAMVSVEASGPDALAVTLSRPDPAFVADALLVPIAPARILAPLIGDGRALARDPELNRMPTVTAGPFRLIAYDRVTDTLTFAANPDDPWQRPHISRLVLQYEATDQIAWQAFLAGRLALADVPAAAVAQARALARQGRLRLIAVPTAQFTYIAFDMRDPIWSDPRVRQAAIYAVNRAAINRAVNVPPDRLTGGPPPLSLISPGGAMAGMGYDPARARALLAAAGWQKGANGVRYRGKTPLAFTLVTVAGVPAWDRAVAAAAADLSAVGFDVTIQYRTFHDLVQSLSRVQPDQAPGAWALAWQMTATSDARSLFDGPAAFPPGGEDVGRYADPAVNAAMQALAGGDGGAAATRRAERALATALRADPPALFLFQTVGLIATEPGLHLPAPGAFASAALDWPQDWYVTRR